jgi:hypothetical protein
VASVQSAFQKSAGVSKAVADMAAGTAKVSFDPAKTDIEKLITEFKANKAARFDVFKAGEKPTFSYSGKDETLRGRLAIKPADAAGDVVCRINAQRGGENADRWFNVVATGDLATQIDKIRKEGVQNVRITGIVSDAGIKASKVEAE